MPELELSLSNNQEAFPVDEAAIERTAGLILLDIFNNEQFLNNSVLKGYDLSDKTISVDIVLIDDEEMQELNNQYRGKDKPTDVLSFALFADSEDKEILPNNEIALGEVLISLETAKRQADDAGITIEEQIDFLLCHGILHLLGYDHPDEESLIVMLDIQDAILSGIRT